MVLARERLQIIESFKILERVAHQGKLFTTDVDAKGELEAVGFPLRFVYVSAPIELEEVKPSVGEESKDPVAMRAPSLGDSKKPQRQNQLPCFLRSNFRKWLVLYQKAVIY